MSYEMNGTVKLISDLQTFDSGFTKREFVVTTKERFPQDVKFECVKDRTQLLDDVTPGEDVSVHFDIRGNEYKGRYYVNLNCWKLEKGSGDAGAPDIDDFPPADDMPQDAGDAPLPF